MIKVIFFELNKLWRKKSFLFGVMAILFINFLLLFINNQMTLNKNSGAYKKLTGELSGLTTDEKKTFVDELYRRIDGIRIIDQITRVESTAIGDYSRALRKENADVIKEFQSVYYLGNYLHYTENLQTEYAFISRIKKELDTVSSYGSYLENIRKKAGELSQISIFKTESGDSFSEKSIRAQAAAYEALGNIRIDYLPEIGVMSALEFRLSDVLLIVFVLLMASVLLREEKDSGMLALNFSLPGGRAKTAVAKLGAVCVSLTVIVCALYCMNLVYYNSIYGLGSLTRSVQSLPSLIQCTWPLSVGEYILVFLAAKWLSAVIVGAWLMLCTYLAASIYAGWGIGLAFIGANYLIRVSISGIGHFNLFRYLNIFSFMNTNEVLGTYIQLYFFGNPLPILWVECAGGLGFMILFGAAFVWVFHRGRAVYANRPQRVFKWSAGRSSRRSDRRSADRRRRHQKNEKFTDRLAGHELYKLLIMNGSLFIFGAFVLFLIFQSTRGPYFISVEGQIYKDYMLRYGGRLTEDTVALINEDNQEFAPLYELDDALALGILTPEQHRSAMEAYKVLDIKKGVFHQIIGEKPAYIKSHPKAWLVYDSGYNKLFDLSHTQDIYEMMILFLVLIFGFGSLFSVEHMTGMENVLAVTPLGPEILAAVKLRVGFGFGAAMAVLSLVPRYISVGISYGFPQLLAPAQSLETFSWAPAWLSIYHIMAIQALFRVLGALAAVCLISYLSCKIKNTLTVFFVAEIALELCPMLYICGVKPVLWLSVWPLFHFPAVMDSGVPVLLVVFYGILFLGLSMGVKDAVIHRFCMPQKTTGACKIGPFGRSGD